MSDVGDARRALDRERREREKQLMDEYMRNEYYPKAKAIQDECVAQYGEHDKTRWHDNGLGWGWWYCGRCYASHGKQKLWSIGEDEQE